MANFVASITWMDEDQDVSIMKFHLVAATIAAAEAVVQNLAVAADAISGAYVIGVTISQVVDFSGWALKSAAVGDADVEIGGQFICRSALGFPAKITVPGYDKDTFSIPGGFIDMANALIINLTDILAGGEISTSHYELITNVQVGYETFRGKR